MKAFAGVVGIAMHRRWRLRSDVNGISAMRGKRASASSLTPSLRAATIRAPSVGSP